MEQERIYNTAVELTKSKRAIDIKRAMDLFASIPAYKDAGSQAQACRKRLEALAQVDLRIPKESEQKTFANLRLVMIFLVVCSLFGVAMTFLPREKKENIPAPFAEPTDTYDSTLASTQKPMDIDLFYTAHPTVTIVATASPTMPTTTVTSIQTLQPTVMTTVQPTQTPTLTPIPTPTPSQTPSGASAMHTVLFGAYEQDNNTSNGAEPIEWIVIDEQDGRTLLLSKYALDAKPFHSAPYDSMDFIYWSGCTMRIWLNQTFLESAFSKEEQEQIYLTTVNTVVHAEGSFDTQDKVFLLSYQEANQLRNQFPETNILIPDVTDSARALAGENASAWWLRTNGMGWDNTHYVSGTGSISYDGGMSPRTVLLVRPAMWVTLSN